MSISAYHPGAVFHFTHPVQGSRDVVMTGKVTKVKENRMGVNSVVVVMQLSGQNKNIPNNVLVKIYDHRTFNDLEKDQAIKRAATHFKRESDAYAYLCADDELKLHVPGYYGGFAVKPEKKKGRHYCIVIEDCDGESAAEVIKNPAAKSTFKTSLVSLVDLFHKKGISHGDIANPENYKVKPAQQQRLSIKVLDWDSAIIKPKEDEGEHGFEGRFEIQARADQADVVILCG
jgi:serine/threonine protein kinase